MLAEKSLQLPARPAEKERKTDKPTPVVLARILFGQNIRRELKTENPKPLEPRAPLP